MVEKFKDAANLIKAKLKKDDLEQSLVQATSEQNWQASTTLLHEIANSAYNYEKCQQINDFIWDKLKKKPSWRKILKTLNLVDFLIKNGPPSLISSYKYQIYTFRSLSDYSYFSDSIDRGEAIREKSRAIVELLSNQQILQEQRTKAKNIREKMSGITGGSGYGSSSGYGSGYGQSKYQGYDSKNYKKNQPTFGSGNTNTMNTAYGDYNYNKSTLDKYKDKQSQGKSVNITGMNSSKVQQKKRNFQFEKPDITQQQEAKKPFEKIAPKLIKPGQKSQTQKPSIIGDITSPTAAKTTTQTNPQLPKSTQQKNNLIDDDIFGFSQPVQTKPQPQTQPQTQQNTSFIPQPTQQPPQNFINPMYGTTAPLAAQNVSNTQPLSQLNFINPMYGTTAPLAANNVQTIPNMNLINPMYGTTAPLAAHSIQPTAAQLNFINPMYGTTAPMAVNNPYQQTPAQNQNWTFPNTTPSNPYMNINPMYAQTSPMASQSVNQGISLSVKKDDQFGNFQSGTTSNTNVAWLSDKEKGLIDFSDFGAELKKAQTKPTNGNKGASVGGWQW